MNQIKLIKRIWKTGAISLVVLTMLFGGLFLNLKSALATNPNLTLLYLGINNTTGGSWEHSVNVSSGQQIKFYAEIHNTNIGTTANNVKIKFSLPSGSGTSTATVSADNNDAVSDNVTINVNGGGQLQYVAGSAKMGWDVNGDGTPEYSDSQISDNIVGSGVVLGNQQGCNAYIIQISFKVNVVAPAASPSPTPSPAASTPPSGGQEQHQEQTQNNNQSQTVNVTNTSTPQVLGTSVPLKSPDTGVSVAGLMTMFGAGPLGLALARFGRGRAFIAKRKENLAELAKNLVDNRFGKSQDA